MLIKIESPTRPALEVGRSEQLLKLAAVLANGVRARGSELARMRRDLLGKESERLSMVRRLDEADLAHRIGRALENEPEETDLGGLLESGWLSDHSRLSFIVDELLGALLIRADFADERVVSQSEQDFLDLFDTLKEQRVNVEDTAD
jgi:hypothetical protein